MTIFLLHTFFHTDYHSKIWLRHGNLERKIYTFLYRNATSVTTYFKIPINRVIELGQGLKYNEKKITSCCFLDLDTFYIVLLLGFFINYYFKSLIIFFSFFQVSCAFNPFIGSLSSTIKLEAASKVLTGSNTSEKIGSVVSGKECNYEQILKGKKICSEKINTLEAPIESRTSPPHK